MNKPADQDPEPRGPAPKRESAEEREPAASSPTLSRRTLAKGAVWSAPVIAVSAAAPSYAASADSCSDATATYPSTFSNGAVIPVALSDSSRVYAKITVDSSASRPDGRSDRYNLTYGTEAYGTDPNHQIYTLLTTGGKPALILNQSSAVGVSESVTVSFFQDATARTPVEVFNLRVPVDDFSVGIQFGFFGTVDKSVSYQDVITLTGTGLDGTPRQATPTSVVSHYGELEMSYLMGNLQTGLYVDQRKARHPLVGPTAIGGILNTSFGATAGVHSYTLTYRGNQQSGTEGWRGAQAVGLGVFSLCG